MANHHLMASVAAPGQAGRTPGAPLQPQNAQQRTPSLSFLGESAEVQLTQSLFYYFFYDMTTF